MKAVWSFLNWSSLLSLAVPSESPLRRTHSLFWGVRTNDEGAGRPDGFHALVNAGMVNLIAPARALHYAPTGETNAISVRLTDGRSITANAVILATGFGSSWAKIFNKDLADELGIDGQAVEDPESQGIDDWKYTSFEAIEPPALAASTAVERRASGIYRGLVPANNIKNRDFAINGAIFTTNNGYTFEVCAHWISSYFLRDPFLRLPASPEEAIQVAARNSAWLRKRYPGMLTEINESYSSNLAFWSWPQAVDDLLDDMRLPIFRSGGNWLSWPFKVIDLKEIENVKEERDKKRLERCGLSR